MILVIFRYENDTLIYGLVNARGHMLRRSLSGKKLDNKLLNLIESIERKHGKLRRIIVCRDRLGGFASARLLIATLNTIAWSRDIPIKGWTALRVQQKQNAMKSLIATAAQFTGPVVPLYQRAAHITQSHRSNKFTIH